MSTPENIFQQWVWMGLNGKFAPEGDLSIDENGDDVFKGVIHVGEDNFEVDEFGPVVATGDLPLSIQASIVGMKLGDIIALPSCADDNMDTIINNSPITSVTEKGDQIILGIGA